MAPRYRVISGDSHLDIVPERWTPRVPAEWRSRAPRLVQLPDGGDAILVENRPTFAPGLMLAASPYEQHDEYGIRYAESPGTGSPEQRVREQDQDGVDAEVLFTHPAYPSTWRGIRHDPVYRSVIHAYNEFLIEDYAAHDPDRLIPMGLIPDTGLADAMDELAYCARAGFKGVALLAFPSGKSFPVPEDDRFWAAALDLAMPLTVDFFHLANEAPARATEPQEAVPTGRA